MELNEYQKLAGKTAIYPDRGDNLVYPTLGLCGEAGEFAEKVKKEIRDGKMDRLLMRKELGDVLWYLSQCAFELDCTLEDIAKENIHKLATRQAENKLHGSGDER